MNLEQITRPIEEKDIESHEEVLMKKMISIQVAFAERKFQELNKVDENLRFSEVLGKYTAISGEWRRAYKLYSPVYKEEEYEVYLSEVSQKIDEVFRSAPGSKSEAVYDFIVGELERWKESASEETKRRRTELMALSDENKKRAGLLNYDLENSLENDHLGTEIDIHVEELYRQNPESFGPEALTASFQKLAVDIIEKYPQVQKVVGRSWLMSHPLAKRLGFSITETETEEEMLQHPAAWYQLMDRSGQINVRRLQDLMASGKLPLAVTAGEIGIEDFLRRYLPDARKGEITLKRILPENRKKIEDLENLGEKMRKEWNNLTAEEIRRLVLENELVGSFIQDSEIGKEYLEFLTEMRSKNIALDGASEMLKKKARIFQKALGEFISSNLLSDVKVKIE